MNPRTVYINIFLFFLCYIYLLLHLLNAFAIFFTAVSDFENSDDDDLNFIATSQSTEHDDEGGGDSNANNLSRESSTGSAGNRFDQSTRLKPLDSNPPLRKLGGFIDEDEKSKKKKKKTKKKKTKKAKSADVVRFVSDATDGW